MKIAELEPIQRIELTCEIGNVLRNAHMIEAYMNTGTSTESGTFVGRRLDYHEHDLILRLSRVASILGLELVDKAGAEADTAMLAERERSGDEG